MLLPFLWDRDIMRLIHEWNLEWMEGILIRNVLLLVSLIATLPVECAAVFIKS